MKKLYLIAILPLFFAAPAYASCNSACADAIHAAKDTLHNSLSAIKAANKGWEEKEKLGTNIHTKHEMNCWTKNLTNAAKHEYKESVKAAKKL